MDQKFFWEFTVVLSHIPVLFFPFHFFRKLPSMRWYLLCICMVMVANIGNIRILPDNFNYCVGSFVSHFARAMTLPRDKNESETWDFRLHHSRAEDSLWWTPWNASASVRARVNSKNFGANFHPIPHLHPRPFLGNTALCGNCNQHHLPRLLHEVDGQDSPAVEKNTLFAYI